MSVTREEAVVQLSVDNNPLVRGFGRSKAIASQLGQEMGSLFGDKLKRAVGDAVKGFTLVGITSQLRSLSKEFDELKDKPEELARAFGKLSIAEMEALENLNRVFSFDQKSATVKMIGGVQLYFDVLAEQLVTGGSQTQALANVLAEQAAQRVEMNEEEGRQKLENFRKMIREIQDYRAQQNFKNLTMAQQIAHWEKKALEAARERNKTLTIEDFKARSKEIIDALNTIADLKKKLAEKPNAPKPETLIPPLPMTPGQPALPGPLNPVNQGLKDYYRKLEQDAKKWEQMTGIQNGSSGKFGALADALGVPKKPVGDQIADMKLELQELTRIAKQEGLKIQPPD